MGRPERPLPYNLGDSEDRRRGYGRTNTVPKDQRNRQPESSKRPSPRYSERRLDWCRPNRAQLA